ncbi:lysophospholipid acyltransferase family protein [Desulfovibrio mangrovi]|uniref:lysophospholipid acyltransferase family protein n=1 Tax=Desulfovibrio mangrovi TaxID=2976983 RepID=UPI002245492C|nr:lysophospholipid acyltransferase family protein [Desulfovibrio mangrovi]UZP68287.1 lysophospholipid acyltransferase family protein [Desulfovibrio mangrovi]
MRPPYSYIARTAPKLGFKGTKRLACVLGGCMWHLVGSRRRLAVNAIEHHLNVSRVKAEEIAKASFIHNFRSFLELVLVGRIDEDFCRNTIKEGRPGVIEQIASIKGPVVAATAHLGAWEILAGMLGSLIASKQRDALVVVRRNKNEGLHELICHFRGSQGARVVDHRKAVFTVLKALKREGLAAFLVDHNCPRNEAIFLPFLNDIAAVNMGPAVLAVKANATVVPVFLIRDELGGYVFHVDTPLTPDQLQGSRDDKIRQVAEFYTGAVEKYVRDYPEQWFWMHKRWKTRPEGAEASRSHDRQ